MSGKNSSTTFCRSALGSPPPFANSALARAAIFLSRCEANACFWSRGSSLNVIVPLLDRIEKLPRRFGPAQEDCAEAVDRACGVKVGIRSSSNGSYTPAELPTVSRMPTLNVGEESRRDQIKQRCRDLAVVGLQIEKLPGGCEPRGFALLLVVHGFHQVRVDCGGFLVECGRRSIDFARRITFPLLPAGTLRKTAFKSLAVLSSALNSLDFGQPLSVPSSTASM